MLKNWSWIVFAILFTASAEPGITENTDLKIAVGANFTLTINGQDFGTNVNSTSVLLEGLTPTSDCNIPYSVSANEIVCKVTIGWTIGSLDATVTNTNLDIDQTSATVQVARIVQIPAFTHSLDPILETATVVTIRGQNLTSGLTILDVLFTKWERGSTEQIGQTQSISSISSTSTELLVTLAEPIHNDNIANRDQAIKTTFRLFGYEFSDINVGTVAADKPTVIADTAAYLTTKADEILLAGKAFGSVATATFNYNDDDQSENSLTITAASTLKFKNPIPSYIICAFSINLNHLSPGATDPKTLKIKVNVMYNDGIYRETAAYTQIAMVIRTFTFIESSKNIDFTDSTVAIGGTNFPNAIVAQDVSSWIVQLSAESGVKAASLFSMTLDSVTSITLTNVAGSWENTFSEGDDVYAEFSMYGMNVESVNLGVIAPAKPTVTDTSTTYKSAAGATEITIRGRGLNKMSTATWTGTGAAAVTGCSIYPKDVDPVPRPTLIVFFGCTLNGEGLDELKVKITSPMNDGTNAVQDVAVSVLSIVTGITISSNSEILVGKGATKITILGTGFGTDSSAIEDLSFIVLGPTQPTVSSIAQITTSDTKIVCTLDSPLDVGASGKLRLSMLIHDEKFSEVVIGTIVRAPNLARTVYNIDIDATVITIYGKNFNIFSYNHLNVLAFTSGVVDKSSNLQIKQGPTPSDSLLLVIPTAIGGNPGDVVKLSSEIYGITHTDVTLGWVAVATPTITKTSCASSSTYGYYYGVGATRITIRGTGLHEHSIIYIERTDGNTLPVQTGLVMENPTPSRNLLVLTVEALTSAMTGEILAKQSTPYNHQRGGIESTSVCIGEIVNAPVITESDDIIKVGWQTITIRGTGFESKQIFLDRDDTPAAKSDIQLEVLSFQVEKVGGIPPRVDSLSIAATNTDGEFRISLLSYPGLKADHGFLYVDISLWGNIYTHQKIGTIGPDKPWIMAKAELYGISVGVTTITIWGTGFTDTSSVVFSVPANGEYRHTVDQTVPQCTTSSPSASTKTMLVFSCTALTDNQVGFLQASVTSKYNDGTDITSDKQFIGNVQPNPEFFDGAKIGIGAQYVTIYGTKFGSNNLAWTSTSFTASAGTDPTTSRAPEIRGNGNIHMLVFTLDAPLAASADADLSITTTFLDFTFSSVKFATVVATPTITESTALISDDASTTEITLRGTGFDSKTASGDEVITTSVTSSGVYCNKIILGPFMVDSGTAPYVGTVALVTSSTTEIKIGLLNSSPKVEMGRLFLSTIYYRGHYWKDIQIGRIAPPKPIVSGGKKYVSSATEITITGSGFNEGSTVVTDQGVSGTLKASSPTPSFTNLVYTTDLSGVDTDSGDVVLTCKITSLYNDGNTKQTTEFAECGTVLKNAPIFTSSYAIIPSTVAVITVRGANLAGVGVDLTTELTTDDYSSVVLTVDGGTGPKVTTVSDIDETTLTLTIAGLSQWNTDGGILEMSTNVYSKVDSNIVVGTIGPIQPTVTATDNSERVTVGSPSITIKGSGFVEDSIVTLAGCTYLPVAENLVLDAWGTKSHFNELVFTIGDNGIGGQTLQDPGSGTMTAVVSTPYNSGSAISSATINVALCGADPTFTGFGGSTPDKVAVGATKITIIGTNFGTAGNGVMFNGVAFTCSAGGTVPSLKSVTLASGTQGTLELNSALACTTPGNLGIIVTHSGKDLPNVDIAVVAENTVNVGTSFIDKTQTIIKIIGTNLPSNANAENIELVLITGAGNLPALSTKTTETAVDTNTVLTLTFADELNSDANPAAGDVYASTLIIYGKEYTDIKLGTLNEALPTISTTPSDILNYVEGATQITVKGTGFDMTSTIAFNDDKPTFTSVVSVTPLYSDGIQTLVATIVCDSDCAAIGGSAAKIAMITTTYNNENKETSEATVGNFYLAPTFSNAAQIGIIATSPMTLTIRGTNIIPETVTDTTTFTLSWDDESTAPQLSNPDDILSSIAFDTNTIIAAGVTGIDNLDEGKKLQLTWSGQGLTITNAVIGKVVVIPSLTENTKNINRAATKLTIHGDGLHTACVPTFTGAGGDSASGSADIAPSNRMLVLNMNSEPGDGIIKVELDCRKNDNTDLNVIETQIGTGVPNVEITSDLHSGISYKRIAKGATEIPVFGTGFGTTGTADFTEISITCSAGTAPVATGEVDAQDTVAWFTTAAINCNISATVFIEFKYLGVTTAATEVGKVTEEITISATNTAINVAEDRTVIVIGGTGFDDQAFAQIHLGTLSCTKGTAGSSFTAPIQGTHSVGGAGALATTQIKLNFADDFTNGDGCRGALKSDKLRLWGVKMSDFILAMIAPSSPTVTTTSFRSAIGSTRITIQGSGFTTASSVSFEEVSNVKHQAVYISTIATDTVSTQMVVAIEPLDIMNKGNIDVIISSPYQDLDAVTTTNKFSSKQTVGTVVDAPILTNNSKFNIERSSQIITIHGTNLVTSSVVDDITVLGFIVESGSAPSTSVKDILKGTSDGESGIVDFSIVLLGDALADAWGLLVVKLRFWGLDYTVEVGSIALETPIISGFYPPHLGLGATRMTIYGSGFNPESIVTLYAEKWDGTPVTPPSNIKTVSWKPGVEWNKIVIIFDPLLEWNFYGLNTSVAGEYIQLKAIVSSKYHENTAGRSSPFPPTVVSQMVTCIPLAKNMMLIASYREELTITLEPRGGFCNAQGPFSTTIKMLPDIGQMYHLSFNYRAHGYNTQFLKLGAAINAAPVNVPTDQKIVWVAPAFFKNTTFRYITTDVLGRTSLTGFVLILADTNTENITYSNYFHTDNMDWSAGTDAYRVAAEWTATSMGRDVNHYIYSDGGDPEVGLQTGLMWYFESPPAFAANYLLNYNGYLRFHMKTLSGDYNAARSTPFTFITLECESCNDGNGRRLAQRSFAPTSGYHMLNYKLNEDVASGWLEDPKDTKVTRWANPTQCDFIDVLVHLSSIRIYGDLTTKRESCCLDGFEWVAGDNIVPDPMTCYWTDE